MDNNIYIVDIVWSQDYVKKIPEDTSFPNFGLVMDAPSRYKSFADGWSVMIQMIHMISINKGKAYLRYFAWDRIPEFTSIGMQIVLRQGFEIVATGTIVGIVEDCLVFNQLVSWNPVIPKKV